jgi:hypothetical protein
MDGHGRLRGFIEEQKEAEMFFRILVSPFYLLCDFCVLLCDFVVK